MKRLRSEKNKQMECLNIDKYGQQKGILPEGNDLLLGDDVLEVLGGPVEGHGLNGLGCLPSVLEVNSQVGALGK